jgi:hypothetical protein
MSSPLVDDNVDKTTIEERDDCVQERLFEDVTEVQEHEDGSTSPRPELAGKNLPSRPPVRGDQVDEAPAVVRGGVPDVRVEEVQDNQEVHHPVDAWQEDQAVAIHDDVPPAQEDNVDETPAEIHEGGWDIRFEEVHRGVDIRQDLKAAEIRDDAQAGGHDELDQKKLFEAVTEVQACDVRQDAEAAEVCDDAQAGGRDECDQGRLFEAVTEV